MKLSKVFRFEASHILSRHPGKCSRLHGHSWVLRVSVEGSVDPTTGFVMDFGELSKVVNERVIDVLDHRHLGAWTWVQEGVGFSVEGFYLLWSVSGLPRTFYPTCENLLIWIGQQLIRAFGVGYYWSELELEETPTSRATLTRKEFDAAANAK